jgi:hypothetical protein
MMKRRTGYVWTDGLLVLLLLVLAVLITVKAADRSKGATATVRVNGKAVLTLDLYRQGHHSIHGPLGATVIETGQGKVRVLESPCAHKICVRMGAASRNGQTILCVPNRVAIIVESGDDSGVDGVVG